MVITVDADFSRILALESRSKPSLLLLRGELPRRVGLLAALILNRLPICEASLALGAIVLITRERTRIRDLPISPSERR